MDRFFISLYYFVKKQKLISVVALLVLVGLLSFLAMRLQFEEDITKLIPSNDKTKITNKVLKNVNFADRIIYNIALDDSAEVDDLTNYATEFIDSLELNCADFIKDIQGKVADNDLAQTLDFVYDNLPLFLDEGDFQEISARIQKETIAQKTKDNYKTLISPQGIVARKTILKDPLSLSFLGLKKLQDLKIGDNFILHNGFLVSSNKKNLLLFITPSLPTNETAANTLFVEKLYKIQDQLNIKYQKKALGEYFGTTVVAVANATQIKKDIQFTVSIALTILLFILIYFYRKISIPLILFAPTLFGALTAVAFLYVFKSQTSAISLGIGSVLLGITLDYSLHILTHYRNNRNIDQLYKDVTMPILMSSLTTAVAFLCLLFLKSEALQDLGIFAAVSVISSSIFALLFIPHVYKANEKAKSSTFIDKLADYPFDRNKILIASCLLLLAVSWFTYGKVEFNKDLSNMNYQSEALSNAEKNLDAMLNTASKSIYVASYAETVEEALFHNDSIYTILENLKNNNKIVSFSSIGSVVLSQKEQLRRIEQWNSFWTGERKEITQNHLLESGNTLGFKPSTFQSFYNLLNKKFTTISIDDYAKVKGLFVNEYISDKNDFSTVVSMVKVSDENSEEVVAAFLNASQTVVIDRKRMNEIFLGNLKVEFNALVVYSMIAVFLILFFFFRNISLTLITAIPIILTWFLTIGLMGLIGIEFTIFNIIISSFIFGLGVDYSIFITNGLIKEYKYGRKELPTYKTSIILSVITTLLGVGVLIFAKHPALQSISLVSIVGILAAVLIAFTIQPLLFKLWISHRTKKGLAPWQLRTFIHGVALFAFYGFGGMFLSIFSFTILRILPFSKKRKMKWLHNSVSKLVTAVLYGNPFVKKVIINKNNEAFKKPAIIISNHGSSLDTLTLGMMTENLIYLVNDWVYKSPVFGLIARVAGFYPVSKGIDGSLDHLAEKVRQGYMLVVFPESRRQRTNKLGRFHKGAFFLAEQMKMDILPIYLHGNSEVLPKGDNVIYDGSLTVIIGDRIKYDDPNFGETYKERQKSISKFYKSAFHKIRNEIEQAGYFKGILMSNYIYKGKRLYREVEVDFEQNKTLYRRIADHIPLKTRLAHFADNFGQLDILLVSRSLDRKITTFISDKEKASIAANCYTTVKRKANYVGSLEEMISQEKEGLLITTNEPFSMEQINEKNNLLSFVILVNRIDLKKEFVKLGFKSEKEDDQIIYLTKQL